MDYHHYKQIWVTNQDAFRVQYLSENGWIQHYLFVEACIDHNLEMAIEIDNIKKIPMIVKNGAFINCCQSGHLDILQWLHHDGVSVEINPNTYQYPLIVACGANQLAVVQWLYQLGAKISTLNYSGFHLACQKGNLAVIQWLWSIGSICSDVSVLAVKNCFIYGQLEIIQWFKQQLETGLFDIIIAGLQQEELYFISHLNIVKWLLEFNQPEITSLFHRCLVPLFRFSCCRQNIELAQWLYQNYQDKIGNSEFNKILKLTCQQGYLTISKWLYEIGGTFIDFSLTDFTNIIKSEFFLLIEWMNQLTDCPVFFYKIHGHYQFITKIDLPSNLDLAIQPVESIIRLVIINQLNKSMPPKWYHSACLICQIPLPDYNQPLNCVVLECGHNLCFDCYYEYSSCQTSNKCVYRCQINFDNSYII